MKDKMLSASEWFNSNDIHAVRVSHIDAFVIYCLQWHREHQPAMPQNEIRKAYEDGYSNHETLMMDWIEKWNGTSNSLLGKLLNIKIKELQHAISKQEIEDAAKLYICQQVESEGANIKINKDCSDETKKALVDMINLAISDNGDENKGNFIKILQKRNNDSFSNGLHNFEYNTLTDAINTIIGLVPPSYFITEQPNLIKDIDECLELVEKINTETTNISDGFTKTNIAYLKQKLQNLKSKL